MKSKYNAIQFGNLTDNHHKCYSEREGDWVVFRCPICHDFERRINKKTGKMVSKSDPDNFNLHHGYHLPPGLDTDLYNPN